MSSIKVVGVNARKYLVSLSSVAALLAPSHLRAEPGVASATRAVSTSAATKASMAGGTAKAETGVPGTATSSESKGGDTLGGHIGVAVPMITFQGYTSSTYAAPPLNKSRTVDEQFNIAFPIGVTIKTSKRFAFDFDVTVATQVHPTGSTGLTIDPGVLYDWGPFGTGLRIAFPVGASPSAVGLIPLINRGITKVGGATWFAEADFPIIYHGSGSGPQPNGAPGVNSFVEFSLVLQTGFVF